MVSEHLIEELRQLKRAEKLRVIQMLVNQITQEEEIRQVPSLTDGHTMHPARQRS